MRSSLLSAILFAITAAIGMQGLADDNGKVLFIGDSHSQGVFGDTLDEQLRVNYRVSSYGVGRATPQWYENGTQTPWNGWNRSAEGLENRIVKPHTPKFIELLAREQPKAVVIELGTNLVWGYGDAFSHKKADFLLHSFGVSQTARIQKVDLEVENQVRLMAKQARQGGRACIWVGPPQLGPHRPGQPDSQWRPMIEMLDRVRDIERKVTMQEGCKFVDSYLVTGYPDHGGDGVHYDGAGPEGIKKAKEWAHYVKDQVDQVLEPSSHTPSWNLTPPASDPQNQSYSLNKSGLDNSCGWTHEPHYQLNSASTANLINTTCAGGRALCKVSWMDKHHRKKLGSFYLNFSCRAHTVSTQGYDPKTAPSTMDWLQNFEEECQNTASLKISDLLQAGCEPSGPISPATGSPESPASTSGQPR
jgi:hypothetical protein